MAASPLRSNFTVTEGSDYQALWKRLEKDLLEIRQNTANAICVEDDLDKSKILRGTWGAYGLIYNKMQEMMAESRGEKPEEE